LYQTEIVVPNKSDRVRLELPEWQGSVAVILFDGQMVSTLGWQPYQTEFEASPGKHTVAIRIVSTPRNLLGPFHNPAKLRMRAWPAAWAEFPEHAPAGSAYDVLDYGLMKPPLISAGRGH
jgi:hypothetical protein